MRVLARGDGDGSEGDGLRDRFIKPATLMEARIIERLARSPYDEVRSIVSIERRWKEHLLKGGVDDLEALKAIAGSRDPFWFDAWESARGANRFRHAVERVTSMEEVLQLRRDAGPESAVDDLEQDLARAKADAAREAEELRRLSLTEVSEVA